MVANVLSQFSYAYGLFSQQLQDNLGFSLSSADLIASFGQLGLWSTFIVGLMLEKTTGTQVLFVGAGCILVGLGYVGLALAETVPANVASLAFMFLVANFGSCCLGTTSQALTVRNFPAGDRGKVAGLVKSSLGISSAVLGVLYEGLLGGQNVSLFIILLSVGVPAVTVVAAWPQNVIPAWRVPYAVERAQGVSPAMSPFYVWFWVLMTVLVVAASIEAVGVQLPYPWTGLCLLALVASAVQLPGMYGRVFISDSGSGFTGYLDDGDGITGGEYTPAPGSVKGDDDEDNDRDEHAFAFPASGNATGAPSSEASTSLLLGEHMLSLGLRQDSSLGRGYHSEVSPWAVVPGTEPSPGGPDWRGGGSHRRPKGEMRWWQCLRDRRWWVLWVSFACGAGAGLVVINNVVAIALSLGVGSTGLLVTLLGIANALGRLGVGWASDRVVAAGLPRSLTLCAVLLVTAGVDFLLAAGVPVLLYPLCIAAGVCYGGVFALMLTLTGDLFGARHIGTNYGVLETAPVTGSFVFASGVVTLFYSSTSSSSDTSSSTTTSSSSGATGYCLGAQCFRGTFFVTGGCALLACSLVHRVLARPGLKADPLSGHHHGHAPRSP